MKRRFAVILVAGLFLSACGNDEVSTSCKKDETNCEGNQLLTCGDDGTFVKTTCENQICAKDGDKHRCMTQEDTARQLGYSGRHIQRIEADGKEALDRRMKSRR